MATSNSVQPASRQFSSVKRQRHAALGTEKLGCSASIPSKFQTLVWNNGEKKGFNSGSRRFVSHMLDDSPGPAQYKMKQALTKDNTSFSTKGLGGFVSKVKRFPVLMNENQVAPGHYATDKKTSHYFNKANCTRSREQILTKLEMIQKTIRYKRNFHKPIAVSDGRRIFQTPAPNKYNLTDQVKKDTFRASAAFLSNTKREMVPASLSCSVPAPGTYDVTDSLTTANPRTAQAPFKSTTKRDYLAKDVLSNPGPGTYNPYSFVDTTSLGKKFARKHYLCISAPAVPVPAEPPTPGPGHYNLVNYAGPSKHYVSSSMFVSTANRWDGNPGSKAGPGPGSYYPREYMKQSFNYNSNHKWI